MESTVPSLDTKADAEPPVLETSEPTETKNTCNCDVKLKKQLSEMKDRLDKEHKEGKQKALDELSERVSTPNTHASVLPVVYHSFKVHCMSTF